jgi:hypothetical protein
VNIKKHVEHLFGDTNLPKDRWLRAKMSQDGQYWVNTQVLVGFKSIKRFGQPDVAAVAAALRDSSLMDVSDDGTKVRRNCPLPQPPRPPTHVQQAGGGGAGGAARWEWLDDGGAKTGIFFEFSL